MSKGTKDNKAGHTANHHLDLFYVFFSLISERAGDVYTAKNSRR